MKKRIVIALLLALALCLGIGCALADTLDVAESRVVLGVGQKLVLDVEADCTCGLHTSDKVVYTSTKTNVAVVNSSGRVTAKGTGTCYIKMSWAGLTKKVKVTVKIAPTSISVSPKTLALTVGDTETVTAKLNSASRTIMNGVTFSSNKKGVATVDEDGVVTAVGEGTCYITAKTYNGLKAKVKVTVTPVKGTYRALLIGNENYYYQSRLYSAPNNVAAMRKVLLKDVNDYTITKKSNLTAGKMVSAIKNAFSGATENDVSLLYYAGHGNTEGSLIGIDDSELTLSVLYNTLKAIPGRVVLVLDTCYSGMAIDGVASTSSAARKSAAAFNSSVIGAFSHDVLASVMPSSGEFCESKFVVITSSAADEESWNLHGGDDGYFYGLQFGNKWASIFTNYLTLGSGWNLQTGANSLYTADANKDGAITISEAASYTGYWVANAVKYINLYYFGTYTGYEQNVQTWPANSSFALFTYK